MYEFSSECSCECPQGKRRWHKAKSDKNRTTRGVQFSQILCRRPLQTNFTDHPILRKANTWTDINDLNTQTVYIIDL